MGYLLLGCKETLTEEPAIRRLVNETPYEVVVEVFGSDERFTYELSPFDSLDINGVCVSGVEDYCDLGWVTSLNNATITFEGERVQEFEGLPDDPEQKAVNADPRGVGFGYVRTFEEIDGIEVDVYTYRITQEDYDNAEIIQ